jgi:hypothetical protein
MSLEALLGEVGYWAIRLGSSSKSNASSRQGAIGALGVKDVGLVLKGLLDMVLEGLTGPFQVWVNGADFALYV